MPSKFFYIRLRELLKQAAPLVAIVSAASLIVWFIMAKDAVEDHNSVPELVAIVPEADYAAVLEIWETQGEASRSEVRKRMMTLASLEAGASGHSGAHWWVARDLIESGSKGAREAKSRARMHLERAIALDPGHEEACRALTQLYAEHGRVEEAISLISKSVSQIPNLRLTLARLYAVHGENEAAQSQARLAAEHWQAISKQDPSNVNARLQWAQAELLLEHDDGALTIIEEGRKHGEDSRFDQAQVSVIVRQASRLLSAAPPAIGDAIEYFGRAFELVPGHVAVIQMLSRLGQNHTDHQEQVKAILLQQASAAPDSLSIVHLALGTIASTNEDYQTARIHFEKAYELEPTQITMVNNLAWCLIHTQPAELSRALSLINDFLNDADLKDALMFNLLDTRGRILIKLGKYEEGAQDLERALRFLPPGPQLEAHDLLAEAYQALGMAKLADNHCSRSIKKADE